MLFVTVGAAGPNRYRHSV